MCLAIPGKVVENIVKIAARWGLFWGAPESDLGLLLTMSRRRDGC